MAIVCVAAFGGYRWVHVPLFEQRKALIERTERVVTPPSVVGQGTATASLDQREARLNERLRGKDSLAKFLLLVDDAATRNAVQVRNISAGPPVSSSPLPASTITLQTSARFDQVMRFTDALDAIAVLHRVQSIAISKDVVRGGVVVTYQLVLYSAPQGAPVGAQSAPLSPLATNGRADPFS